MNYKIFILLLTTFATMSTAFKMFSNVDQQAFAQTVAKRNVQSVVFVPPKDSQPKYTTGGASRNQGKCPQDSAITSPYLTAVIPSQNKALTTQARPTLLVYLPDTSASKAFFSISEISSNQKNPDNHYQTFLPIENKSGIVQFTLPQDAPELELDKTYKWSFVIICNSRLKPDSPGVEGLIERVSINNNFDQQLKTASSLEKAVLYGQGGLWYDSVASFTDAYHADPHNLNPLWQDLLSSEVVGLEELTNQPILK